MASHGLHQLLVRTVGNTAARLTAIAETGELPAINERDHLQKAFNAALEEETARLDPSPAFNVERTVDLPDDFHRVGGIDNSVLWPDGPKVFIELKAGTSLDACAWDAVKLAAALRAGQCDRAFLIAAAPTTTWERTAPGSAAGIEFFRRAEHAAADLRERYASSWRRWDLDGRRAGSDDPGYAPKRAAAVISTEPDARDFLTTAAPDPAAAKWEIRASEIRVPATADSQPQWFEWTSRDPAPEDGEPE